MESRNITTRLLIIGTLMVLMAAIFGHAKPANDVGNLCGMSQEELVECKPAVAMGSAAPPPPSAACCAALQHANVTCLCGFKNYKYLPLLGINSTLAMQLPTMCDPKKNVLC